MPDQISPVEPPNRTMINVMEPFSYVAGSRNWKDLDGFFNPHEAFDKVAIVSVTDNHDYDRLQFGRIEVHPIPSTTTWSFLKVANNLVAMWKAFIVTARLAKRDDVELIVQTFGGPLKYGLPAIAAGAVTRVPVVLSLHSDYPVAMKWNYSPLMRRLARVAWRHLFSRATAVRSVSGQISGFARSFGMTDRDIRVIPNKENLDTFLRRPTENELARATAELGLKDLPTDAVIFLTVGRLIAPKNIDGMLRALARASQGNPRTYLLVAGDGPLEDELRTLAEEVGVADRVRFLGFVDHSLLPALYRLSDVLLFPTHYEGQPRVIVEALLSGLPIICSNYGQVCDIVRDGEDGVWVDPKNTTEIAQAILLLARKPELRAQMSRHDSFDADTYSMRRVGWQEAAFYEGVISREEAADDRVAQESVAVANG